MGKIKYEKFYEKIVVLLQWYFLACIFQEIILSDAETIIETLVQVSRTGLLVKYFFTVTLNNFLMESITVYFKLGEKLLKL